MTRLDQDGDGSVDFVEFVAFMLESKFVLISHTKDANAWSRNTLVRAEESAGSKEALTAAFSAFDADKDGLISPNDLR